MRHTATDPLASSRKGTSRYVGLLLITSLFACGVASAQSYRLVDLATLAQGNTVVRGPNSAGSAVGGGRLVVDGRAVGQREGLLFEIGAALPINGLPRSDYTTVFGLNDLGGLVGSGNSATAARAFAATRTGGVRELPPLPGDIASTAYALNNQGQAAGFSSGPAGERATIWSAAGAATALPGGATTTNRAYSINERGDTAGVVGLGNLRQATLWPAGGLPSTLGMLSGCVTSEAASINARGDAVGHCATAAGVRRAVLWPWRGSAVDLGVLPGAGVSQAYGNNDAGVVVGSAQNSSGRARAVIWSAGGLQDLNTLIAPAPVVLTHAVGINSTGMIVAVGSDVETHAGHEHNHDHELPVRVFLLVRTGG